jgi:hypothetical protein
MINPLREYARNYLPNPKTYTLGPSNYCASAVFGGKSSRSIEVRGSPQCSSSNVSVLTQTSWQAPLAPFLEGGVRSNVI